MDFDSPTRFSIRRNQCVLRNWLRVVLLILVLVSSPFQFSLASCICPQGQCCSMVDACQCCEVVTKCCCASTHDAENDAAESHCPSCGSQCQCGTIEVTSSSHQICQTESAKVALLSPRPSVSFSRYSLPSVAASHVSFVDLVSLRLHAFLCVWLN